MISIALYQPDIPQNAGTILRLAACLSLKVHIVEPAGFVWSQKQFRRSGMDYLAQVETVRHANYETFASAHESSRLVLLTTQQGEDYTQFEFADDDILLLGRESAGVPQSIHDGVDARVTIPMARDVRSLNVAVACAMVTGEALRQTRGFSYQ